MSEGSLRFYSWWTRDWVSQYGIIAFVCTVTSRRVGCECTVGTFTTLGECVFGTTSNEDSEFETVNEE